MIKGSQDLHSRIDPELAEALAAVPKLNGRIFDLAILKARAS